MPQPVLQPLDFAERARQLVCCHDVMSVPIHALAYHINPPQLSLAFQQCCCFSLLQQHSPFMCSYQVVPGGTFAPGLPKPPSFRNWRGSIISPFAANIAIVLLRCSGDRQASEEPWCVRLVYNEHVMPILLTKDGTECSLQEVLVNPIAFCCLLCDMRVVTVSAKLRGIPMNNRIRIVD